MDTSEYLPLWTAVDKLTLNDSDGKVHPDSSVALGKIGSWAFWNYYIHMYPLDRGSKMSMFSRREWAQMRWLRMLSIVFNLSGCIFIT